MTIRTTMIQVLHCFLILFLLSEVAPSPVPLQDEHLVSIQLLSETPESESRVRRDANSNLPQELTFQVPMQDAEVYLRLKQSRPTPTVTSHSPLATSFVENTAVYTDGRQAASLIVRKEGGEYSLRGTFVHGDVEWNLAPLSRERRQALPGQRWTHRVFPVAAQRETISFIGDEIMDTEPPVEILSLEDRNRYRMERAKVKLQQRERGETQRRVPSGGQGPVGNRRFKRDAVEHVVEMVFVVDHADYQKWVALKGASNAISEMTLWYTYVAEAINIRYRTIADPDIALGTVVTFLRILTTDSDDDFIEDLISSGTFDGGAGLNAFRTWIQDPANNIPNADHYMYFTGFDIGGASGIAFGSRVCTVSGVSITENSFTAGVGAVAAHELGHSLSAIHDANAAGCSDTTQNIMSTIFSLPVQSVNTGNPWKFSSCSIDAFKSYLAGFTCTEPQNTGTVDALPVPVGDARAGIAESRDDQCILYFQDSSSSYCNIVQDQNGGENSLCGGMFCAIPGSPNVCRTMLPLEFTTCGTGKWCRLGFCVDVEDDTTTTTQTPSTTTPTTTTPSTTTPSTTTPSTTTPSTTTPTTTTPTTTTPSTTTPSTTTPTTTTPSTTAPTTTTPTTTTPSTTTSSTTTPSATTASTTTASTTTASTTTPTTTTPTTTTPTTTTPSTTTPSTTTPTTTTPTTTTPTTTTPTTTTPTTTTPSTTTPTTTTPTTTTPTTTTPTTTTPTTTTPTTTTPTTTTPTTTTPSTTTPTTTTPTTTTPTTTTPTTTTPTTTTPTTTTPSTTTSEPTGPTSVFDCIPYLRIRDIRGFWDCIREVWAFQRRSQSNDSSRPSQKGNQERKKPSGGSSRKSPHRG